MLILHCFARRTGFNLLAKLATRLYFKIDLNEGVLRLLVLIAIVLDVVEGDLMARSCRVLLRRILTSLFTSTTPLVILILDFYLFIIDV